MLFADLVVKGFMAINQLILRVTARGQICLR